MLKSLQKCNATWIFSPLGRERKKIYYINIMLFRVQQEFLIRELRILGAQFYVLSHVKQMYCHYILYTLLTNGYILYGSLFEVDSSIAQRYTWVNAQSVGRTRVYACMYGKHQYLWRIARPHIHRITHTRYEIMYKIFINHYGSHCTNVFIVHKRLHSACSSWMIKVNLKELYNSISTLAQS